MHDIPMMLTQKEALIFKSFLQQTLQDGALDDTLYGIINDVRDQIVAMDRYWINSDLRTKEFEKWLEKQ